MSTVAIPRQERVETMASAGRIVVGPVASRRAEPLSAAGPVFRSLFLPRRPGQVTRG
jgi:hypothetical protein